MWKPCKAKYYKSTTPPRKAKCVSEFRFFQFKKNNMVTTPCIKPPAGCGANPVIKYSNNPQ